MNVRESDSEPGTEILHEREGGDLKERNGGWYGLVT